MGPFLLGVLCSAPRVQATARTLRRLLRRRSPESLCALVFPLEAYDPATLRVSGLLVADGHVSETSAPLPAVVLNLSVQCRRADVKKLRSLCADAPTFVLNQSNRLRLPAVLAMLESDPEAVALLCGADAETDEAAEPRRRCTGCLWRSAKGWQLVWASVKPRPADKSAGPLPWKKTRGDDSMPEMPPGAREAMLAAARCVGMYLPDLYLATVRLESAGGKWRLHGFDGFSERLCHAAGRRRALACVMEAAATRAKTGWPGPAAGRIS